MLAFPPSIILHDHISHRYRDGKLILQDKASSLLMHLLNPISMETKKSRKKRKSKHENTLQETNYDEKEQNKEIEVELPKIKKKKENKEIKIDKIYKIEQAEETVIEPSKKRKKSKEIY
ncbi:hypothetical protein ALC57_18355 [Trachymyrmex cornetzi]|uniref:Uncharacterized protein n=1 Tax=Trachymyrmex cornetzi TaxID=471704 RepID=A0A151IS74_9HYME|nr:hypothetical protein ALC57_18355 [Trachymyrmex cornetzi]